MAVQVRGNWAWLIIFKTYFLNGAYLNVSPVFCFPPPKAAS